MRPHRNDAEIATAAAWTANRRRFLTGSGAAVAAAFVANTPTTARAEVTAAPRGREYPFTLGVASGDPWPDAVVLWTRIAPRPFEPYGGLSNRSSYPVQWEVATDEAFTKVVRRGTAFARPEYNHTVHVDVRGLQPGTRYFYRFRSGLHLSETGRTRTTPAPGAPTEELDLVVASCQSLGAGFYHAWDDAAKKEPDVVLFLGDYIYEYAVAPSSVRWPYDPPLPDDFERGTDTLERFRLQYALYKTDPQLITAHQMAPWMITWDDHEVYNDYQQTDPAYWTKMANGYRAFWEHLPLRPAQLAQGREAQLYRRFTYGDLAEFSMLDARQYRSKELDGVLPDDGPRRDPDRTILGPAQREWLLDGLGASTTKWNVMAQGVLFGMLDTDPGPDRAFASGAWDGYQADQQRVIDGVRERDVDNFVVLTGDIHRNYDMNLLANFDDPDSEVIGVEFAGTSISSGGDGVDSNPGLEDRLEANPHLKFANLQRGYLRCHVDHESWRTDLRVIDTSLKVKDTYQASTRASFVTEAGNPGLVDA
ncbi:alkaline phosphatase D family protein [Propionibacteriaceae bacterium Y1685]